MLMVSLLTKTKAFYELHHLCPNSGAAFFEVSEGQTKYCLNGMVSLMVDCCCCIETVTTAVDEWQ